MSHDGVFISYRRGMGSEVARILQEFLEGQGFDVFLDVDSLGAGHFDEQLLEQIESRRNFVLVCSPGSLDRCANEGDWVRREIAHALKTQRHIVPVTLPQFTWPSGGTLAQEIADLQRHNAFEYSHMHWRLIKPRLVEMLRAGGRKKPAAQPAPSESPPSGLREDPLSSAMDWCDILAQAPDPSVVTDAAGRSRMTATRLPWKVRDRKTGIVMLLCPPGEFVMGSPKNEVGRTDNEAQQRVSITRAFYISETEVTQEQWQRTMGANPSYFKGASNPVEQVSWNDCQGFCAKTGLRLPSEAEWEYACRAGTTGAYAGDLDAMAWYRDNSGGSTHPVKQKRANPWGLYDMHGNVWEWCQDGYATKAAGTQEAAGASSARVLRGGSWSGNSNSVRSSSRGYAASGDAYGNIGFRIARDPF
jgi:formylglycine-generating enzyme required for sulfatase activity